MFQNLLKDIKEGWSTGVQKAEVDLGRKVFRTERKAGDVLVKAGVRLIEVGYGMQHDAISRDAALLARHGQLCTSVERQLLHEGTGVATALSQVASALHGAAADDFKLIVAGQDDLIARLEAQQESVDPETGEVVRVVIEVEPVETGASEVLAQAAVEINQAADTFVAELNEAIPA